MTTRFKVLVLGGYGVFGARVCRRLMRHDGMAIVIAGRSRQKADTLAAELGASQPPATLETAAFDVRTGLPEALAGIAPDMVIDATGPFQEQGYATAEACIAAGVHYADLADARAFVRGFGELDERARQAGVVAISGASSVPGLSTAVVDHLRPPFCAVESIAVGIAPGNRAPRGRAVVAAVLGYAGRPMPRWTDGRWTTVHGWQDLRRREIEGVGRRWFAACDVPDIELLPARYPEVRSVTFHAGLELSLLHLGLWLLSWPARWRLLPNLARFARPMRAVAAWLEPFGTDLGGMFVELAGTGRDGKPLRRVWSMRAGAGHGPFIPCIPAVLIAKKLADRRGRGHSGNRSKIAGANDPFGPGARPCFDLFTPAEFMSAVADLDIEFGTEDFHG